MAATCGRTNSNSLGFPIGVKEGFRKQRYGYMDPVLHFGLPRPSTDLPQTSCAQRCFSDNLHAWSQEDMLPKASSGFVQGFKVAVKPQDLTLGVMVGKTHSWKLELPQALPRRNASAELPLPFRAHRKTSFLDHGLVSLCAAHL